MPITGGSGHPILSSTRYNVEQVRSIGGNKLLLIITGSTDGENGLWVMNTNGTGMLHLNTDDSAHWSTLNEYSQYTWSNVSRDGTMYAFLSGLPGGGNTAYSLVYGRYANGSIITFASTPDGNDMMPSIVGWTTM